MEERGALWAVILAGGDGFRLRPFLRSKIGADRPKQFCAIIGTRSMLRHTLDRAAWLVPPERTVTVVTAGHRALLAGDPVAEAPRLLVEQPRNRDTGPGVLLSLVPILRRDPHARVVVFPSDHFVLEEGRFMTHVAEAVAALPRAPGRLAVLGMPPNGTTTGYGWIEPSAPVGGSRLLGVHRFWEKPARATARRVLAAGGLINTFVVVADAGTLWSTAQGGMPDLAAPFERIARAWDGPDRARVIDEEYAAMRPANFSREVLERFPARLAVLPVGGVLWSDWGEPARVVETVRRLGLAPPWMTAVKPNIGQRRALRHA
jgi:mannose-1-phosphate guanylyltransferase